MNIEGDPMENMVGLVSRIMNNVPITGLILRLWGAQGVNPANLSRLMKK